MRRRTLATLMVLIAALFMSALVGSAQNGISIQTAKPIRLTVAPGVSSPVAMKTLPEAACLLHTEGAADTERPLKLFADDEGIVRFDVNPAEEFDQIVRFQIDCVSDGKTIRFPLELRPRFSPTPDMPAPVADVATVRAGARVRPALTEDDALHLPSDELVRRGYPMRPDLTQEHKSFALWLKAVTQPSRFVSSRLVARSDVAHSTATSYNWSGFALNSPGQFAAVWGDWSVPGIVWEFKAGHTYSALWVGLDGIGTSDLVQAGTEQDLNAYFGPCCPAPLIRIATYYAWTEFLPQQGTEQLIPNFTVRPGDEISVQVSMHNDCTDSGGVPLPCVPVLPGQRAIFNIENITRSEFAVIQVDRPQNVTVNGFTAEWIMERPSINGVLPDLTNYGVAYMDGAYAMTAFGSTVGPNYFTYDGTNNVQIPANSLQISMYGYNGYNCVRFLPCRIGTGNLLSDAFPVTNTEMQFVWRASH